jgi:polyisoprenoid-binding protein YceI
MTKVDTSTPGRLASRLRRGDLAGDWILDQELSRADLRTRSMWGMAGVRGTFGKLSGAARVSPAGKVTGTLAIAVDSLSTKNRMRDGHLRSAALLDLENHPSIVYSLDGVEVREGNLVALGRLAVRGVTRDIVVPLRVTGSADTSLELSAQVTVDRAEFGISWNPMRMASLRNEVTITAAFRRL